MRLTRKLRDVSAGDEFESKAIKVPEFVMAELAHILLDHTNKEVRHSYGNHAWLVSVEVKATAYVELITSSGSYSLAIEMDDEHDEHDEAGIG